MPLNEELLEAATPPVEKAADSEKMSPALFAAESTTKVAPDRARDRGAANPCNGGSNATATAGAQGSFPLGESQAQDPARDLGRAGRPRR